MIRKKKIPFGRIIHSKVHDLTRVFNFLHDSNSNFRPAGIKSERVVGTHSSATLEWTSEVSLTDVSGKKKASNMHSHAKHNTDTHTHAPTTPIHTRKAANHHIFFLQSHAHHSNLPNLGVDTRFTERAPWWLVYSRHFDIFAKMCVQRSNGANASFFRSFVAGLCVSTRNLMAQAETNMNKAFRAFPHVSLLCVAFVAFFLPGSKERAPAGRSVAGTGSTEEGHHWHLWHPGRLEHVKHTGLAPGTPGMKFQSREALGTGDTRYWGHWEQGAQRAQPTPRPPSTQGGHLATASAKHQWCHCCPGPPCFVQPPSGLCFYFRHELRCPERLSSRTLELAVRGLVHAASVQLTVTT